MTNATTTATATVALLTAAPREKPVATLQGETSSLDTVQGRLQVNNARGVERDMQATHGVIHAIDAVLMPTPP